ncbi:MAG: methylated-DNA--[protein]-cysteine S-methyltransferase [Candidatus Omnitrophica bacterium]|nr:methylated-DNA--[protein]-cysteine S-methyltransferase [Candidatus Omnitrophota bacterium]
MMYYSYVESPVGCLLIVADEKGLRQVNFPTAKKKVAPALGWTRDDDRLREAREQLEAYFRGDRKAFDLPLVIDGTAFQREVLRALQKIPYGETRSYADIARTIGRPKAVRAVGGANGRNPLSIVIPCHRVIGASGELTGFGGGLDVKKALLELERKFNQAEAAVA